MSEELGYSHAAKGIPKEPERGQASSSQEPPQSQISPTPPRSQPVDGGSATKRKFVPGGGSALAAGDKPGDPFASLIVLPADLMLGTAPKVGGPLGPVLDGAFEQALRLVEAVPRCVVVTAGGAITTAMMTQLVLRMPGGIDSFGPGKRVESLLKERSAPWGSLWESALLVKALAKRQASTVRFGTVVILCAPALVAPTLRAYTHVFSDWRVLVDGGLANGGRDDALDVRVEAIEGATDADEKLAARAATLGDEAYYTGGLTTYAVHPWWPKAQQRAQGVGGGEESEQNQKDDAKRARVRGTCE